MFDRKMPRMLVVLAVAGVLAVLLAVPAAAGTPACYGVQGSATTVFDPAVGGFVGDATMRLNGNEYTVPATAFVTGETSTMHIFETPWGTLVTNDELILVPVDPDAGIFSLRSRLTVIDGGSGKLQLLPQSRLDLINGVATWEARGHLCIDGA